LILEEQSIELILLDWMLPQMSGLEVCRQVKRKKASKKIPVIMLTARGEEDDKIRGLDIGADDYVVKPYSIKELMARVRAGLRNSSGQASAEVLVFQELSMNLVTHTVAIAGCAAALGPLEFKLLRVFMETPGRVLSRDQLLDRVWGDNLNVDTRTVDVHVARLRKALSKASDVGFVRTVRGFGYSLDTSA
jgi:two-component system phosphate regulon response regulator PhoB